MMEILQLFANFAVIGLMALSYIRMIDILVTACPMFVGLVLSAQTALQLYRRREASRLYLLCFMLVATLFQLSHFLFFNRVREAMPFADSLFSFTLPALFVFYYYFIDSLTTEGRRTVVGWLLLLPSVLCAFIVAGFFIAMTPQETNAFLETLYVAGEKSLTGLPAWQWMAHRGVILVFVVQTIPVVLLTLRRIKTYNEMVSNRYSDTDDKAMEHVLPPLFFLFFVFVVALTCFFVKHFVLFHYSWLIYIVSIVFSILLLLMGSHALEHKFSYHDMVIDEAQDDNELVEAESQINGMDLKQKVIYAIKTEKLYLQPNLKINDLARHLHTNRSYIYNVVNVEMGISFAELVNRERVAYAISLMQEAPNMLLSDVAVKSGFSSNVSFYRNFKKYQGISPKEFQQQLDAAS